MKNKNLIKSLVAFGLTLALTVGSSAMVFAADYDMNIPQGYYFWNYIYDAEPFDSYTYSGRYPSGSNNELYDGGVYVYGQADTAETTEVEVTVIQGDKSHKYTQKFRVEGKVNDSGIGDGKMLINWDAITGFYTTKDGKPATNMQIVKQGQGALGQAAFAAAKPYGWKTGFMFDMYLDKKADNTLKDGTFTLILPTDYIKPGRTFAIMAIDKDGSVKTYNDTDSADHSVTVPLNVEGYAFQLIYFN
ncbi:MAG: hypothetical protein K6G42_07785 [Lachnospiraceae bacterium]|nr:hypothetical protein [Lachnospiraceae bacterium]